MSEVPFSLEELKVGFGISILTLGLEPFFGAGNAPLAAIRQTEISRHGEAAERVRASDPTTFEIFGKIASRMLDHLPDNHEVAITSLMSDIGKNLYGIGNLLRSNAHPYFTDIFRLAPFEKDPDKMKACFEAVAAFGRGE